ncbi:MAG: sodium:solute symporter [Planctomycetes bacterium GWF2_41_51]|nr:MAG: sodium:solute symporter [Planctomycetes bacterium GWF2_41_51]HBG25982.1 sodium:solute symporter [Phycisphaerales bacterium]
MNVHPIDTAIIAGYMVAMILIGFWVTRKASKNLDSYFLGDKSMPWYMLGISNAASMFDVSGTMWLVYLLFVYGIKSAFIPWLWPTFNQIFLMVYLAVWLRRSNVLTGAEWIRTRFGNGVGADLSYFSVVIFALVSVIGFTSYGYQGIGKFAAVFLPWDVSPHVYAIAIIGVTTLYTMLGGMYSVVITDVAQFLIMCVASVAVGIIAMSRTSPEAIDAVVPAGWENLWFGWKLNMDWTGILNAANTHIQKDGWSLFTIFMMMVLFKGVLASMAGPAPNYDLQRVLSCKSTKAAAMMSASVSFVLFIPRYLLIAGITVLAIVFFSPQLNQMGENVDFEQILPYVIGNFIPVGLMGLLLAGLLAAFMSTFSATINAGAAYIVNDIYKGYINKNASNRKYIVISCIVTVIIVLAGIAFGLMTESINQWVMWIVAGLYGGYVAPNVLKWHWWRLNGFGYFAGMMIGIIASILMTIIPVVKDIPVIYGFPFLLGLSLVASIVGSLLTPIENEETLKKFYKQVRPWGFWGPIKELVLAEDPNFVPNKNFGRDMINVAVGIVWQLTFTLAPIYLVIKNFKAMTISLIIMAVTSIFMKLNWYDKLEKD